MSGRLVGEVVEWLLTPVAMGLTTAERAVLLVIAERAHEQTREMWRHRGDDLKLHERVALAVGTPNGLKDVLERLADHNLEVRIPIATGKDGRTVFAARGRPMRFRLPEFPASVQIPGESGGEDRPFLPGASVDNPSSIPVDNPNPAQKKGRRGPPHSTERGGEDRPIDPERGGEDRPLIPSKEDPSKTFPSTPVVRSPQPDVERAAAVHREPSARSPFRQPPILLAVPSPSPADYTAARDQLRALPDLGQTLMRRARDELGDAPMTQLVIHAANLSRRTA